MFEKITKPTDDIFDIEDVMKILREADDIEVSDRIINEIANEVQGMYTSEVLEKSKTWHIFSGSTLKEDSESLPESVEDGIKNIIQNLLERKVPQRRA